MLILPVGIAFVILGSVSATPISVSQEVHLSRRTGEPSGRYTLPDPSTIARHSKGPSSPHRYKTPGPSAVKSTSSRNLPPIQNAGPSNPERPMLPPVKEHLNGLTANEKLRALAPKEKRRTAEKKLPQDGRYNLQRTTKRYEEASPEGKKKLDEIRTVGAMPDGAEKDAARKDRERKRRAKWMQEKRAKDKAEKAKAKAGKNPEAAGGSKEAATGQGRK
ncbi:hypothetical protein C8J56DRAFT_891110 [Mycena floridula]|nr:hypothetical protein C8J56DRAFT_891110 [Mycena floridula]